jgi:hypothetical protein
MSAFDPKRKPAARDADTAHTIAIPKASFAGPGSRMAGFFTDLWTPQAVPLRFV